LRVVSVRLPYMVYEELVRLVREGHYPSCSEAIRDAIARYLVELRVVDVEPGRR